MHIHEGPIASKEELSIIDRQRNASRRAAMLGENKTQLNDGNNQKLEIDKYIKDTCPKEE